MKFIFSKRFRNLIANLRELPEENTFSVLRKPKTIGFLVQRVMQESMSTKTTKDIIQENWGKIIGEKFYKRTIPTKITDDNILIVTCQNVVIRSEMSFLKPSIIEKVRALPRCESIADIRFIA